MASERHMRQAFEVLRAGGCVVSGDTYAVVAAALAEAEMRSAERVRDAAREIAAHAEASVVAMEEIDALDLRAILEEL